MSNFKLKHQSKSGLFRHADWHKEFPDPSKFKNEKKLYIPSEVERPIEYIPSYQTVYEPPQNLFPDIKKMPKVDTFSQMPNFDFNQDTYALEESANMRNREKNRIKYENQALKRAAEEAAREAFEESMQKHRESMQNMPEIIRTSEVIDEKPSLQMVKNNSATPYKLPHQSKSAFRYGHNDPPPFSPANNDNVPSFQETFANSSGGKLTPDERAEAIRLLDSTRDTYVNQGSKRIGKMVDGKVVFENVPVSPEEGLKEWQTEGMSNYYVDFDKDGKAFVKSVPRGDDDIPVQSFLKGLDSSQYRGEFFSDLPDDYQDPGLIKGHPLNPNEGYHRVDNFRN